MDNFDRVKVNGFEGEWHLLDSTKSVWTGRLTAILLHCETHKIMTAVTSVSAEGLERSCGPYDPSEILSAAGMGLSGSPMTPLARSNALQKTSVGFLLLRSILQSGLTLKDFSL